MNAEVETRPHAILSASGSSRWMNCPGSVKLIEALPEVPDTSSKYSEEGTKAHELAEKILNDVEVDVTEYPGDMVRFVNEYVLYVRERAMNATHWEVEKRVEYTEWVPEGFGTADVALWFEDTKTIEVIDLKYGKGVRVDAEDNSQLQLYSLGLYQELSWMYDIDYVVMTIHQPRRDHISSAMLPIEDLLKFGAVVEEAAGRALSGNGDLIPGETQCQWCPVRGSCRARAEINLEIAMDDFGTPPVPELLSPPEVAALLPQLDQIASWVKDVKNHAHKLASRGTKVPGYKLIAGRSIRGWTNKKAVIELLKKRRYKIDDIFDKQLKGIPAIEELMGEAKVEKLLSDYIHKPEGKPALVPESDKRPEMGIETAQADFANEDDDNE